jgi:MFS family permease
MKKENRSELSGIFWGAAGLIAAGTIIGPQLGYYIAPTAHGPETAAGWIFLSAYLSSVVAATGVGAYAGYRYEDNKPDNKQLVELSRQSSDEHDLVEKRKKLASMIYAAPAFVLSAFVAAPWLASFSNASMTRFGLWVLGTSLMTAGVAKLGWEIKHRTEMKKHGLEAAATLKTF